MSARGKKIALIGGAIVVLLILIAVFIVPSLVNVDRYRPQVVAQIEAKTGMPARIGKLALTVFPQLSIRVDDFELDNPPGFPSGFLIKAGRIYAVVDTDEFLHRQIKITSLELGQPDIHLISNGHGRWNYESPWQAGARPDAPSGTSGSSAFSMGVISQVAISHGEWMMADVLPSGEVGPPTVEASDISSKLENVDLSAFSQPEASLARQPGAAVHACPGGVGDRRSSGRAASGLIERTEAWLFPVAYAAGASEPLVAQGTLDAGSLRFGTMEGASLRSKVQLFAHRIFLNDISLGVAGGKAQGGLTLDFSGANLRYNGQLKLSAVDMARLLRAFPQASGKMTGTLDGGVTLAGAISPSADPLSLMKGSGQATVRNGKLPTLQLNRNLTLLARLANLGPAQGDPSSFSSINSDFEIAQGVIHSRNVKIVGNGVDIDGSGSMELERSQNLDYTGVALLAATQTGFTGLLAGLSGATYSNGHLAFPFDLKGTLENPRFILAAVSKARGMEQVQKMLGNSGSSNQTGSGVVQGIMDLFGKKKQQTPQ